MISNFPEMQQIVKTRNRHGQYPGMLKQWGHRGMEIPGFDTVLDPKSTVLDPISTVLDPKSTVLDTFRHPLRQNSVQTPTLAYLVVGTGYWGVQIPGFGTV